MILIADSGSTKADWIAGLNGSIHGTYHTKGFNPFFHDREFVLHELFNSQELTNIRNNISRVYFFGAGCSSPERNKIIAVALAEFFTRASIIVDHDMLGTALAVCEGKPGIACILGTGSNICYFDGKNISESRHGLGYVIGDEGSGSYYGKKLLAWYLYRILPDDIHQEFKRIYNLDKETIIRNIYLEPNPNVYLASFASFLSDHATHPFIEKLVYDGMNDFFSTNVLSYSESRKVPVHFVGSISWFFRDILHQVATQHGVIVGNIVRKPVTGLADYFLKGGKMP